MALQTIKSLDLGQVSGIWWSTPTPGVTQRAASQTRPAILGAFLGRLSVKRVPNSQLIEVTFEAEDPQLAAKL